MTHIDYVLVTPARNEERFIEQTIRSVITQTLLPKKWVIVSDGSTDRTDEIVTGYAKQHEFIKLLRVGGAGERSCGSKVKAVNAGYEQLQTVVHNFVGNLDADVSFTPDYFEQIFTRFLANPRLGIGGGIIHELIGHTFVPQCISLNSVAGAVQMFRRECWDQIGGYLQVRFGGEDAAAEITARTHGWDVQTFPELEVRHYRRVSTGEGPFVKTKLRHGISHYSLGYHPLFEMVRNAYRCFQPPYVVGALLMSAGYLWALMTRMDRELPDNVVRHLQSEQMHRLRGMLLNGRI
jgi:poly-beta-1,6-N-acetyl-D-glucosamine synthase